MKKPSRKSLIKKLDELVSKIVRKRNPYCVQCGSKKQSGAGHVFSRRFYSVRWDLDNVWTQCWSCNYRHKVSDPYLYWKWYQDKFGIEKFNKLAVKAHEISHFKESDLLILLNQLENN